MDQAIYAVYPGKVVFASWLRGMGLLTIIDHGHGFMTLYGHANSLYKKTGDFVQAGEVIATVGQSGGQQDSGLYFQLRDNGKPLNPELWFRS
jgi:septal ring factor EnvC (AmiA/AmiB activator)